MVNTSDNKKNALITILHVQKTYKTRLINVISISTINLVLAAFLNLKNKFQTILVLAWNPFMARAP